jgi:hypothetical protein
MLRVASKRCGASEADGGDESTSSQRESRDEFDWYIQYSTVHMSELNT